MLLPYQESLLRDQLYPLYAAIAQPDEPEPWRLGYCEEWSKYAGPIIHAALTDSGLEVVQVQYIVPPERKQSLGIERSHKYIAGLPKNSEPILFDGTYLQFSEAPDTKKYPHILMGSLPHIKQTLTTAGITEERHEIWDITGPQIRMTTTHKGRAKAAKQKLLRAISADQLPKDN